jgi:HD-GYP domain-containing protein (c-di-GMP phosphodiesterase class II)/Tfp pilus assembly protein PilZ
MTESPELYNSRIIDTYLKLIKARYPDVSTGDILTYAEMEPYEVADQGHWFTQDQVDRFYEKAVQLTGNEFIAREAGRYAAAPNTLGVMRQYTMGLLGPHKAFAIIGKATKNFVRSSDYSAHDLKDNRVEIVVKTRPGVEEKPYQCENRIGFFEAIVTVFNLGLPKIEHPECMFKGGEVCRYHISWKPTFAMTVRNIRNMTAVLAGLAIAVVLASRGTASLTYSLPVGISIVLAAGLVAERVRRKEVVQAMSNLWGSTEQLSEQINANYKNLLLAQEIGQAISSKLSTDEVIHAVIHILENRLDFDRGLVLLADKKAQHLVIRGAFGYTDTHLKLLRTTSFRLDNPHGRGPFVVAFHQKKPFLINDIAEIQNQMTAKSLEFTKALGIRSFLCCPIILKGKAIGVLGVDNLKSKRPLVQSDVSLLMGIAPVIGISIHNAQLLETQAATFESTLSILADSIDARDFLTAGHSQVVTEYAGGIAKELGMSEEYCQMIRTAALLHDYGKIGVPDSILKKDGPLTDSERAIINTHPAKTREILEKVPFQGINEEIPAITGSHHERWDGTGYPNALKGKDIPLGARILAVADFYEAITSKRHYRDPMAAEEALQTLGNESGTHFEPRIVEAFVRYLEKNTVYLLDNNDKPGNSPVRRLPRFEYRTQVSAKVDRRTISGTSVDISQNGLFVTTEDVNIPPESEITLTFTLPHDDKLVQVTGRVVWVNTGDPRPAERLPMGFGVQFKGIESGAKKALRHYVETGLHRANQSFQFR